MFRRFHPRPPRRGRAATLAIILLVLLAIIGTAAGTFYVRSVKSLIEQNAESNRQRVMQMVGLGERVSNRLDARFTDANGDLIADPPADPSRQIDPPTLVFCYVAVAEPEAYREQWKPFTDHLARVTGKPVEYAMLTSPKDQLKALCAGTLHVTGLNTGSVPAAVNGCGFVPVVKLPTDDGTGMSKMRIIVPSDSGISSVAGLRGEELTLTDTVSNSGFKAPLVLLRSDFGMVPVRDFTIRYSGGHDESIAGIAAKRYRVAAVADDMLARAVARGAIQSEVYRSIYESEKFPTAGIGYVYNLKPELAAKVREALLTFDWKGTVLQERLGTAGGTKFLPANYKEDWALIRRIDDESGATAQAAAAQPLTAQPSTAQPATRPAAPESAKTQPAPATEP